MPKCKSEQSYSVLRMNAFRRKCIYVWLTSLEFVGEVVWIKTEGTSESVKGATQRLFSRKSSGMAV